MDSTEFRQFLKDLGLVSNNIITKRESLAMWLFVGQCHTLSCLAAQHN